MLTINNDYFKKLKYPFDIYIHSSILPTNTNHYNVLSESDLESEFKIISLNSEKKTDHLNKFRGFTKNVLIINPQKNGSIYNFEVLKNLKKAPLPELLIFIFNSKNPPFINPKFSNYAIPNYPLLTSDYLIISTIHFLFIDGFYNKEPQSNKLIQLLLPKINYFLGGILTNNSIELIKDISNISHKSLDLKNTGIHFFSNSLSNYKIKSNNENIFNKLSFVCPVIPQIINNNVLNHNMHGWFHPNTKEFLLNAIETCKPKIICELGSWLGLSSSYIVKSMPKNSILYCVDIFTNYMSDSGKTYQKINVIDRFYLNFPRYETTINNICRFNKGFDKDDKKVFTVKYDVRNILELMKKCKLNIDLVFMDSIKNSKELYDFLTFSLRMFPELIIVGDDHVFPQVSALINKLNNTKKYSIITNSHSYIICNKSIENENKLKIINDKFKNYLEINEINTKNQLFFENILNKIMDNVDASEILDLIKSYNIEKLSSKLSLNQPIESFPGYSTIYHMIAKYYKLIDSNFTEYEEPEKIYNQFILTYEDYLTHNIYMD